MIASLRGRLVAGVLALAAAGMLLVGGITYATQRSFQLSRVDAQLAAATQPLVSKLAPERYDHDDYGPHGPHDGGPPLGGGPSADTYGQIRDSGGNILYHGYLVPEEGQVEPSLPADIPAGQARTVGDYRVLATSLANGLTVVTAVSLADTEQTLHKLLLDEALVIAGVLVLLGLLAWAIVRIGLLPLDRMGHTAAAIAGGDLSHRVETTDPRTEVGRLGIALNRMLDRLEAAFAAREASQERLRRFLADASHELRTPLASIRGYAELHRMGATRSPAEVERSMGRIEDEAARMGLLVEDLLTLARLDEVREAEHVPLDLAALARDAVDDARATAPERAIGLRAEPARVSGDAHQLRQVLANLLRNALVHTPEGTPVEVSVTAGDEVRLEVRDHGPGLPTGDAGELFERFWRAEGGRERGKGGAGLGLAIVAGIVDAHGGRVSAANAPDGGAVFTVRLPSDLSA
jgi:two-component system, OmpR family, sensor kinase